MTITTTLSQRFAAFEALRPEAEELTRLLGAGHDIAALKPRLEACSDAQDQALRALSHAVEQIVSVEHRCDQLAAIDGAAQIADHISGWNALYDAIVATGYDVDRLLVDHVLALAEEDREPTVEELEAMFARELASGRIGPDAVDAARRNIGLTN